MSVVHAGCNYGKKWEQVAGAETEGKKLKIINFQKKNQKDFGVFAKIKLKSQRNHPFFLNSSFRSFKMVDFVLEFSLFIE